MGEGPTRPQPRPLGAYQHGNGNGRVAVKEPNRAELVAQVAWHDILAAVGEITSLCGADYFAEYDAQKLEEGAMRLREKLKDVERK